MTYSRKELQRNKLYITFVGEEGYGVEMPLSSLDLKEKACLGHLPEKSLFLLLLGFTWLVVIRESNAENE